MPPVFFSEEYGGLSFYLFFEQLPFEQLPQSPLQPFPELRTEYIRAAMNAAASDAMMMISSGFIYDPQNSIPS